MKDFLKFTFASVIGVILAGVVFIIQIGRASCRERV